MLQMLVLALLALPPADERKAETLAHRSIVEYTAGDFEKALGDATAAYELDQRPALLFNLGQCHRALEHWSKALFFYRGYLRENPEAPNRAGVQALIAEMEAKLAPPAPAGVGVATPAATANAPGELRVTAAAAAPATPTAAAASAAERRTEPPAQAAVPVPVDVVEPSSGAPRPAHPTAQPADARPAPAAAVTAPAAPPHRSAAPWWIGGAGLAAAGVGVALRTIEASTLSGDLTASAQGYTVHSISAPTYMAAQNEGLAAQLLLATGGVLVVTAAILLLTR